MRAAAESWLRGNIELHGRWADDDPVDEPVTIVSTRSLMTGDRHDQELRFGWIS
jgi:hypothetical protein